MIKKTDRLFTLATRRTTYLFAITDTGHLEHLYYGKKLNNPFINIDAFVEKRTLAQPGMLSYESDHPTLALANFDSEYSFSGKGEFRETMIDVEYGRGMQTLNFVYHSARILSGKPRMFSGLPQAYGDKEQCQTLEVLLKEKHLPLRLVLTYTTFYQSDVITRRTTLYNDSNQEIRINNLASLQLDLNGSWNLTTFDGAWGRERKVTTQELRPGLHINESRDGTSSSEHNPAIFLHNEEGEAVGVNLIYSSSHRESIEVSAMQKTRILTGINPATFTWLLAPQDRFQSPEAILTYSDSGIGGASQNFHHFINNHIVRGKWKYRERPVRLHSWEATGYKFKQEQLLTLAREGAELGCELFVLDDGWFGLRHDETSSLGDWDVNTKKIPSGLAGFSREIHLMGMLFGLWIEPEMVSTESQLYKQHPEWVIAIPGRQSSVAKHQYILDLTRQDVRDYLYRTLKDLFRSAEVDYIKWDFNRTFSDLYSNNAEVRHHGEFHHRYILGLYEILEKLNQDFPNILFETTRFDLGMLSFMSQAEISKSTDALNRLLIQEGSSFSYPLSTISTTVTGGTNHQSLRVNDLESAFNVAAFGSLGYSIDLGRLKRSEREIIRSQIAFYKGYRSILQYGAFTRVKLANAGENQVIWAVASADKQALLVLFAQQIAQTNPSLDTLRIKTVDTNLVYEVFPRKQHLDLQLLSELTKHLSPLPTSEGGVVEETISKAISLESEVEYYKASGEQIAYSGIKLNNQYNGESFDTMTRFLGDMGSRIYLFKAIPQPS